MGQGVIADDLCVYVYVHVHVWMTCMYDTYSTYIPYKS